VAGCCEHGDEPLGYVATVFVYYLVVVKTLLNKRNTNLNAMDD
jgi:hypothetical protein